MLPESFTLVLPLDFQSINCPTNLCLHSYVTLDTGKFGPTYSTNPALTIAKLKLGCASAALCSSVPFCSHMPLMSFWPAGSSLWLPLSRGCSSRLVPHWCQVDPWERGAREGHYGKTTSPGAWVVERGFFSQRNTKFSSNTGASTGVDEEWEPETSCAGSGCGGPGQEMLSSSFVSERGLKGGMLLSVTGFPVRSMPGWLRPILFPHQKCFVGPGISQGW